MKKLVGLLIIASTFFALGFVYEFHYPRLKTWVKTQIYLQSYDKLPVLIKVDDLELSPFTLSAVLFNTKITPKKDLKLKLSEIEIDSIDIEASFLSLFLGRFEISSIHINKPKISYIHQKDPNAKPFEMPKITFNELLKIPVDELKIDDAEIAVRLDDIEQSMLFNPAHLQIRKGFSTVFIEINIPEVKIKQKQNKDSLTAFGLYTKLSFTNKSSKLLDFKLTKDSSFIVATGETEGNPLQLEFNSPTVLSSWNVKLDTIKDWILSYQKKWTVPTMSGQFEGSVNLVNQKNKNVFNISSTVNDLNIEGYDIGSIVVDGQLRENVINANAKIKNKLQDIQLADIKFFLDQKHSFETVLHIHSFELNQLLRQIKVGPTSLKLLASAKLPCSGVITPDFYANCTGSLIVEDFYVKSSSNKNIVAVQKLEANGNLHVNKSFIVTDAKLKLANSSGQADARVDFASGYKVNFQSDNFQLANVKELAGLKLQGINKLRGSTEGNSKKGVFTIATEASDASFEDFYLGSIKTKISYEYPNLKLSEIEGSIQPTDYSGSVNLDFNKDNIDIKFKSPNLNASIIPKVIEKRFALPFIFSGSGTIDAHIHGPLELSKLNYDVSTQLQRLLIGKESIDKLQIQTKTEKGVISLQGTELSKSRSKIRTSGTIKTDGTLNIDIKGSNIRLEESESIQEFASSLNSIADVDGKIRGTISNPDIDAVVNFKESTIGSAHYSGGSIEFKGTRGSGTGKVQLFNEQLLGTLKWNYDTKSPIQIDANFNNWDFSPIFSIISAKNERDGYKANVKGKLSLDLDLHAPIQSTLNMEIENFLLARGLLELKNKETMKLNFDNEGLKLSNFELYGNNSKVQWLSIEQQPRKITLQNQGNINLALISFLTPFLSDVRGQFSFQSTLKFDGNEFEALGNAKVNDAYAKLTDFPVPFEKIEADFLFSQNKISINRFRSEFGGGLIRGSGNISVNGVKNVPIRIEAVVDNSNIQLSKGLSLVTSGSLTLAGSWFPYVLKGDLDIRRGTVAQDSSENKNVLRKSYLLPSALKAQESNPIELDINANLIGRNIKVVNEFVNTSIAGDLRILGNPVKPTLNGTITQADRGNIIFNEHTFEIDTLNVSFNNDQNMNPNLYVLANTRVREYDITMTVGGTLQDLRPSFTSQPPLNEADIITLLTLGYTQSTLAEEQNDTSGSGNAIGIGTAIINRNPLNKQIEDKTGISVRFNSAVDSADENITVPKVEVSKKWGSRLETKASRTFGKSLKNDAKVQYKINDKVSVIGSWEAETNTDNSEFNNTNKEDVFGLDLEYKIEFK